MSAAGAQPSLVTTTPEAVPRLVCAEVWGGNRPINAPVRLPGIRGRIYSRPCAGGRGGDIHYLSICNSGLLSRMCIADVAGHGEAVARVSGELHRLLRRHMNQHDERRILADLNASFGASRFSTMTTAAAVTYLPPLRSLAVSYAGHPPAWLYRRREKSWSVLEVGGERERAAGLVNLPLAIDAGTSFSRRRQRVRVGDRLVLVTDGVLEAPAPDGELFGTARLAQVLKEQADGDIDALPIALVDAVIAHTRDAALPHDDLTVLAVEFVRGPRAFGVWQILKNNWLGPRPRSDGR